MSEEELKNKYEDLQDYILELVVKYVEPHRNSLESPSDYKLDVRSFCILCHAAFEEFLENITLYSIDRICGEFNSKLRKISYATICFLHFDEHPLKLTENKKWESQKMNDYLASRLKERKSELSSYATQENHGIDVKYLRKLLLPIGIDVPKDPKIRASLDTLKNVRGAYAHSYTRIDRPLAPEDAERTVEDVLEMVTRIKDKALCMSYYLI